MPPFNNFTTKAKEVIKRAHELAIERGQNHVSPTHLLSALLMQEESIVLSILERLEMDTALLTDSLLEIIDDIKFETLGCGAAIATSSILTEMAKGQLLVEALKIGKLDIAKELGGLPAPKLHCSILAHEGLAAAAKDYYEQAAK